MLLMLCTTRQTSLMNACQLQGLTYVRPSAIQWGKDMIQTQMSYMAAQVAWSPAWGKGSSRHAMVAVSTKAGRVWLWRYHLPAEYSAACESRSLADKFTLVPDIPLHRIF